MADDRTRAVAYLRQSLTRGEVDESLSLEFQERRCREYAAERGWELVEVFIDPDTRGWRTDRPAFDAMLARFRTGGADVGIVYKLARFARNLIYQETVLTEVAEAGGELVSVTEPWVSTSPMVRQIMGAVNEQATRDQSDYLKDTFKARVSRGKHHGPAPIGYTIGDDGVLQLDEPAAETIRLMFQWAREGHGSPEITYRLNERGLTTRTGRQWNQATVLRTLRNPTFAGHVVFHGDVVVRDAHPAIVSPADFEAVQEVLSRRTRTRRKESPSWADGFVWHACGDRMHVAKWSALDQAERWRFRCGRDARARKDRTGARCGIHPKSIFQSKIEEAFLDLLIDALSDIATPEQAARRIEAQRDGSRAQREKQRARLARRIDDVQRQRDRLLDLTLAGRVDDEMYTERDVLLKDELARLRAEHDAVPEDVSVERLQARGATITRIADALPIVAHSAPERLPELLHELGVRMVVGDGDMRLAWDAETGAFVRGS